LIEAKDRIIALVVMSLSAAEDKTTHPSQSSVSCEQLERSVVYNVWAKSLDIVLCRPIAVLYGAWR